MNSIKSISILLFGLLILVNEHLHGQENLNEKIKTDIETLTSKKYKGRLAGTKANEKAAEYVAERFEALGLIPKGDNETYFQHFKIPTVKMHGEKDKGIDEMKDAINVVGFIDNGAGNESTIIIGAHYDHLGMGYENSKSTTGPEMHPGADDNASGVAMILMLAERLKNERMKNNVLIVAFDAEEQGLMGSKYFSTHLPGGLKIKNLNCMFNFDMVGRLNDDHQLILTGTGTSPKWSYLLKELKLEGGTIQEDKSGLGRSDHTSFYLKEVPVLNFFTGVHEDYHKPSDIPDSIDYAGMTYIADFAFSIIMQVDRVIKLSFTATEDEKQRQVWENPDNSRRKYKVTLGVMPDYTFSGGGMRIESVIHDRPAAKAGMKDGDIVIQLGDFEVSDLQTYMDALSNFNPGDKTTVKYKRGENTLETELEF